MIYEEYRIRSFSRRSYRIVTRDEFMAAANCTDAEIYKHGWLDFVRCGKLGWVYSIGEA